MALTHIDGNQLILPNLGNPAMYQPLEYHIPSLGGKWSQMHWTAYKYHLQWISSTVHATVPHQLVKSDCTKKHEAFNV